MQTAAGKVFLVGAGPGDPGLITARGIRCLAMADLVLFDYLVNPLVLQYVRPATRCMCLGRHGQDFADENGGRSWTQDEINQRMIAAARRGERVVRLKSGDPMIFGRAAQEMAALDEANIPYELVPGVTAAIAVGSYASVPLTDRAWASSVAIVTGQQQHGKSPPLDYRELARFPGTLVFYMGVTSAASCAIHYWPAAKTRTRPP